MLCPSDYRVRLVPRNAGWFPRLGQGALPRSRKSTSTLWVLPVLCLSSYFRLARGYRRTEPSTIPWGCAKDEAAAADTASSAPGAELLHQRPNAVRLRRRGDTLI